MNRIQNRSLVLTALLLAAAGLLILGQAGFAAPIKNVFLGPLTIMQSWLAERFGAVSNVTASLRDLQTLRERNAELERQVAELQSELARLREDEARLAALSALLEYARGAPESRYVTADVIGRDESPFLRFVILNKGTNDGIRADMPVVNERGLVGLVAEVTSNAAKVLLITDASSAVNARLQTSRQEGVVVGQLTGEMRMQYINLEVEVKPGEAVLTSGLGGKFPPDILIGHVVSVRKRTYDLFQEADIAPAADPSRLEIVLIITNYQPPNLAPFQVTPQP